MFPKVFQNSIFFSKTGFLGSFRACPGTKSNKDVNFPLNTIFPVSVGKDVLDVEMKLMNYVLCLCLSCIYEKEL